MKNTRKTDTNKPRRVRFPVFESIGQTAAALGVPAARVKQAKRAGCAAFLPGNRIDTAVLIPFLFKLQAKNEPALLDPGQERAKLDAVRRRELEDAEKVRRGELHVRADVEKFVWENALLPTREAMLNLSRVCAAQCNPADPALATNVLNSYVARLLKQIRDAIPPEMKDEKSA